MSHYSSNDPNPQTQSPEQPKLQTGQPIFWRPESSLPFRVYGRIIRLHAKHAVIVVANPLGGTMKKRVERTTLEPREWREGEVQS